MDDKNINLVLLYKGKALNLPSSLDNNGIYFTSDEKNLYIQLTQFLNKDNVLNLRKNIDKADYKLYIGITEDDPDYNTMFFINDGSGIIFRGLLFINNPYWVEVVDSMPDIKEDNTLYLIKE